jgi:hypothetical protein
MSALIGIKDYIWAALAAALLAFGVTQYVGKNAIAAQFSAYKLEVAQATAQQEASARDKERQLATTNERLNDELTKKDRLLAYRDVAARRSDAGLRDEIARLNARPAPSNPESAAFADEARLARELLGSCSEEYRGMALEADGLRDQVSGLHTYIEKIVQPGK